MVKAAAGCVRERKLRNKPVTALQAVPQRSRPRELAHSHIHQRDDNAYSESLFRTAKYRPEFPPKGFADLAAARSSAANFVRW